MLCHCRVLTCSHRFNSARLVSGVKLSAVWIESISQSVLRSTQCNQCLLVGRLSTPFAATFNMWIFIPFYQKNFASFLLRVISSLLVLCVCVPVRYEEHPKATALVVARSTWKGAVRFSFPMIVTSATADVMLPRRTVGFLLVVIRLDRWFSRPRAVPFCFFSVLYISIYT